MPLNLKRTEKFAAGQFRMNESIGGSDTDDRFKSLESMEGMSSGFTPSHHWQKTLVDLYPGTLVAATIALAASWLSQHYGAPVMLFALLIGMAFHFFARPRAMFRRN